MSESLTPRSDSCIVTISGVGNFVPLGKAQELEQEANMLLEALKEMLAANSGVAVMPTLEAKRQNAASDKARTAIALAEKARES